MAKAQTRLYLDDLSLGQRFESGSHRVEAEEIKTFAQSYDPQPFHLDEDAAKDTFFAGLAASGWHVAAITMKLLAEGGGPFVGGIIGGGGEIAWPKPTRPGDVLQVTSEVVAITPSRSKPDRGMVTLRSETRDQNGQVAQVLTAKLIVPRRPAAGDGESDMKSPSDRDHREIRDAVRALCAEFPAEYHRAIDEKRGYPEAFVEALTKAGWLAALIPEAYGGAGLGLAEASVIMEEINRCGGNSGACHGQMYNMGTLVRHGSEAQRKLYLPRIASGELRLQSMGVTEPETGTDTTKIKTSAVRKGDRYVINGQKVWISRVQHSDLMILLARTTPLDQVKKKSEGMSIFLVDLRDAIGKGLTVRPIANMVNHETNELFFDDLEIPAENRIGEEGQGFKYILTGLNAERVLIAAECIGDGRWFLDKVTAYVKQRVVFGRPIGQNQGVQFPIAESYIEVEAADLMRWEACRLYDSGEPCGAQANMAKYLAAKASWEAANACIQFHGGFGFACEYDVERKFRETRLYQVAPISTNLILSYVAEHVLELPRSF